MISYNKLYLFHHFGYRVSDKYRVSITSLSLYLIKYLDLIVAIKESVHSRDKKKPAKRGTNKKEKKDKQAYSDG